MSWDKIWPLVATGSVAIMRPAIKYALGTRQYKSKLNSLRSFQLLRAKRSAALKAPEQSERKLIIN